MKKAILGFRIYKIWHILKRFARTFHPAQTLKLGGVSRKALTFLRMLISSSSLLAKQAQATENWMTKMENKTIM